MQKIFIEDVDYKMNDQTGELLLRKYGMMEVLHNNEEVELVFIQEDYSSSVYRVKNQNDNYYYCEFIHSVC